MLEAILYGIIQGITEFLPISSSAHLIIVSSFLNDKSIPVSLNIALHFGTCIAVLTFFSSRWWEMFVATKDLLIHKRKSPYTTTLIPAIIVGTIPAATVGLLAKDFIKSFHQPYFLIIPLFIVGIILWLVDKTAPEKKSLQKISIRDGLLIGIAQSLALIPGTSRSGSTIIGGRLLGLSRKDSVEFSFLLGTPVLLGATILSAKEISENIFHPLFYLGIIVSFSVGLITIKLFLHFISKFSFLSFAIYRVIVSVFLYFYFIY